MIYVFVILVSIVINVYIYLILISLKNELKYEFLNLFSDIIIRNSEILCGSMDKNTLGSGTKCSIFYIILRDFGELYATKAMWRLSRVCITFVSIKYR